MFKGTHAHPQGEFSNLVSELGGQENAFTSYDYTAYFQRIGKEHLGTLMEFEADRMTNLVLSDEVVRTGARGRARGAPHAHRCVCLLYTLLILGILLWNGGLDHSVWVALFGSGAFRLVSFLFMMAVLYHAWVGVRNIAMDYVKPTGLRVGLQVAVICALVAYAGWTIQVLWGAYR